MNYKLTQLAFVADNMSTRLYIMRPQIHSIDINRYNTPIYPITLHNPGEKQINNKQVPM